MRDRHSDQSVAISFGEVAWLLLLGVLLVCGIYITELRSDLPKDSELLYAKHQKALKDIRELEKTVAAIKEENERWKKKIKLSEKKLIQSMASVAKLKKENSDYQKLALQKKDVSQLLARLDKLKKENSDYQKLNLQKEDTSQLLASVVRLKKESSGLQKRIIQSENELRDMRRKDTSIRKELIGLKGDLHEVVFVLDKSYSMFEEGRWEETCDTVKQWLTYLNVEKCILILFSGNMKVISSEKRNEPYLVMQGGSRDKNLDMLLKKLKKVESGTSTNTYAALKKAFEYEPNTIILFTDGAPRPAIMFGGKRFDRPQMEKTEKLCSEHKDIPVNIIALGDYFDRELCSFLRKIAKDTGGMFLGK